MPGRTASRRAVKQHHSKLGRPLVVLAEVYRARVTLQQRSAPGGLAAVLPALPHPTDAASLVASAREAFVRGDFPACVKLLERQIVPEGPLRAESLFILARALIRLQRAAEVVALLEPALPTFAALDEICMARGLHGMAVALARDVDEGLQLLAAAALFADSHHVHRSIRGELSYFRSAAYWTKREYAEASRYAVEAERANLDVLSVRATQIRAFTALAQAKYHDALRLFEAARDAYKSCRGRDVDLATQIVYQISFLEMNLRSAEIAGSHRNPDGRTIPGASFGPAVRTAPRMLMAAADAWLYALDGSHVKAIRKSMDAIDCAPSSAWRVWALAAGATLCEALQETANARCLAEDAEKLAAAIDWNSTVDEERIGLLWLAEVCAIVDPSVAVSVLGRYDGVTSAMGSTRVLRDADSDPRMVGWDAYVRGLVARALGDYTRAADWLRTSADHLTGCGYLWRAALALIELASTPIDTTAEAPLERAAAIIRDHFPDSFLAARLGWARIYLDPIGRTLTAHQVDVLRRVLENQSIASIARATFRAESTVRKHLEAVELAFETHSIPALILECLRRGIVPPSMAAVPLALPHSS
jgi:tetratricopeptide (TPR) repeat protein/DNA-binding CsgD family transcriptional regulator